MRITTTRVHDATVEELHGLLIDPESIGARRPDLAAPPEVRPGPRGQGTSVEMRRLVAINDDASIGRLLSPLLEVDETITWSEPAADGSRTAAIATIISGAPVRVVGSYDLRPHEDGCTSLIELDLTCTMAMLGGRLMSTVRGLCEQRLVEELDSLDVALAARVA